MTHIENCHVPTTRPYTAFTACSQTVSTSKIVETRPSCPTCEKVLLDFLSRLDPALNQPRRLVRRKKRTT